MLHFVAAATLLAAAPTIDPSKPLTWGYPGAPFVLLLTEEEPSPELNDMQLKLDEVPLEDFAAQHGLEFFITEIAETGDPVVVLHEPVFGVGPYRDLAAVFQLFAASGGGLLSTSQLPPESRESFARMFGRNILRTESGEVVLPPWFIEDNHPFAILPSFSLTLTHGPTNVRLDLPPDVDRRMELVAQTEDTYQELTAQAKEAGGADLKNYRYLASSMRLARYHVTQATGYRGRKEAQGTMAAFTELWRRRMEAEEQMLALAGSSIRDALAGQFPPGLENATLPLKLSDLPPEFRVQLEAMISANFAEHGFASRDEARAFLAAAVISGLDGRVEVQIPQPTANMGNMLVWRFPLMRPQEP